MHKETMLKKILQQYEIFGPDTQIIPFGSGLINHTWRVDSGGKAYILQRINAAVFKKPENIANNIEMIGDYLAKTQPGYLFVMPLKTKMGNSLVVNEDGTYRVFPFVANSQTIDVVKNVHQAFQAAYQFGRFTYLLKDFDAQKLKTTLADFHNLTLRFQQFAKALKTANSDRLEWAKTEIEEGKKYQHIVYEYEKITNDPAFKIRVTHHDTKISNVLLDENFTGLCVIDLDTVMPGYFISDVGDMMRTYLSPVSEEETNLALVEIRDEYFLAIAEGYTTAMKNELTEEEAQSFVYAGKFMIYMQALRFLTDFLNNDVYYGAKYPGHNLNRAKNQFRLLNLLAAKEVKLKNVLADKYQHT